MSAALYPPPRPLAIGEVLDLAFRIYQATFVKCLLFASLGVVANWLPNLYLAAKSGGGAVAHSILQQPSDPVYSLLQLVGGLGSLVCSAAILLRQYQMVSAQAIGGELAAGLRRLPMMILYFILFGLALAGCGLLLVPAFFFKGPTQWTLIALLALPACYVAVQLSCGWAILLLKKAGPSESLNRSWRLTSGNFWRLTAIYTVGLLLLLVLYGVTAAVTGFLYAVLGHGDLALVAAAVAVVTAAIGTLGTPFYSALGLAVLGDLTVRKEGADLAQRIAAT